ncbi:MAG: FapA family protein [Planctomycetota bacterium]
MSGEQGGIRVIVAADKMSASVRVPPCADAKPSPEEIVALLEERSISQSFIDNDTVAKLIEAASELKPGDDPVQMVVASGTPAVPGEDGRIDLAPELLSWFERREHERLARRRSLLDEPGEPDASPEPEDAPGDDEQDTPSSHYDRHAFCMVSRGQHLGDLQEPTQGIDGTDITGMTIAAREGRPLDFNPDESLKIRDNRLFAMLDGVLEFDGAHIAVARELTIHGSIDFSTGNLTGFEGDVRVSKGVKDCFVVDVGGTLTIHELAEASELRAGKDIVLDRGMAAREKGSAHAGRDLDAKYLDAVRGEAGRDLIVQREIAACALRVGRHLRSPSAVLIGGEVTVLCEAELAQAGTEAGTETQIILGKVCGTEQLALEASETLPRLQTAADTARQRLDQLQNATVKLTATQAEELTELQFELSVAEQRIQPLRDGTLRLLDVLGERARPSLTAHRAICQGVVLWLGRYRCTFKQTLRGPIRVELDKRGEPIAHDLTSETSTPLSRLAVVVPDDRFVDLLALRSQLSEAA